MARTEKVDVDLQPRPKLLFGEAGNEAIYARSEWTASYEQEGSRSCVEGLKCTPIVLKYATSFHYLFKGSSAFSLFHIQQSSCQNRSRRKTKLEYQVTPARVMHWTSPTHIVEWQETLKPPTEHFHPSAL
jgi:hypothetical protein